MAIRILKTLELLLGHKHSQSQECFHMEVTFNVRMEKTSRILTGVISSGKESKNVPQIDTGDYTKNSTEKQVSAWLGWLSWLSFISCIEKSPVGFLVGVLWNHF